MIQTMRSTLHYWAARHGGYGPDEALILLNPFYWCGWMARLVRHKVRQIFNRHLGLDRVVLKDEHVQGDVTITMVRNAAGDQFKVQCSISYITGFESLSSSKDYTRRVYELMRKELWTIMDRYLASPQGDADFDQHLKALMCFQSRWQSYAVCLV